MSLYSNKSTKLLKKEQEFIEIQSNRIKSNRNNHETSLKNQKLNIFLNNCNKSKSINLFKNKSYLFPKITKCNNSKNRKNINLKTYLINNNIIIPTNPFLNFKTKKNTRNKNINLNTINQFNLEKELNNNIYSKTTNNINIKRNEFKYLFKNTIDYKNNKNKYKRSNTIFLKSKINSNNKIIKYHSDKKKTNKFFNLIIKENQKPLNLILAKKNFSDLNESSISQNDFKINKYKSIIKDYFCKSEAGTDIFGKSKINQDSYLSLLNIYNLKNYSVFGIFDGHGINGHLVSKFVKKYFENYFTNLDNNGNLYNHNENFIFKELIKENKIKEIFKCIITIYNIYRR